MCVCRNEVLIKLVNGLYRPSLHSLIVLINYAVVATKL